MAAFIDVRADDGALFQAWLQLPEDLSAPRPAIVLLAEGYNVNHWARAAAQRYADAGYIVLAPDLYWRQQPGVYLDYTPEGQQACRALYGKLDFDAAVRDVQACLDALRARPDCSGKAGLVGYCLGGKIAFLAASRTDADAAVGYYSIDLEPHVDDVPAIACPALFHFGALDARVPASAAGLIEARRSEGQDLAVHVYDKAGHGFGRFGQATHEPTSDMIAHRRTMDLFRRALATPEELAARESRRQQRRAMVAKVMGEIVATAGTAAPDRARLSGISRLLQQLTAVEHLFPSEDFPAPDARCGVTSSRYLLFSDETLGITLYLNAIVAGKSTQPHNHNTWAVIVALQGGELNRIYRRTDDGRDPERATLELAREYVVQPGSPIEFMPDDIHSIHVDDGPTVRHLHLYGQALETLSGRLGFDLETGKVSLYNKTAMRPTVGSDAG